MIKRLVKAKKDKQGAILIVVVLILALAMIFISSALILTQATRNRLYDTAMSSQARLTCTSAFEAFYQALEMQEFTDKQLEALLNDIPIGTGPNGAHTDNNQKIRMVMDGVPGMSSTDNTNSTYLDVYYPTGHQDAKDLVICEITTTIGDEVENMRVSLVPKTETDPQPPSGGFVFPVDSGHGVASTQLRFTMGLGMVDPVLEKEKEEAGEPILDNIVMIRGTSNDTTSSAVFYSDVVFASNGSTPTAANFGADSNEYKGNIVLLQNSFFDPDGSVIGKIDGDIYSVGSGNGDSNTQGTFKNTRANGWNNIHSDNVVFIGRLVQNCTGEWSELDQNFARQAITGKNLYFMKSDGTILTSVTNVNPSYTAGDNDKRGANWTSYSSGTSLSTDLTNHVNKYKSLNSSLEALPESAHVRFKNMNGDVKVISSGETLLNDEYEKIFDSNGNVISSVYHPAGEVADHDMQVLKYPLRYYGTDDETFNETDTTHTIDWSQINSKCTTGGFYWNCPAGTYRFTPGTSSTSKNTSSPRVICIDGSSDTEYRFYFSEGDYFINDIVFAVYNANPNRPVIFVLEPGANMYFGCSASSPTGGDAQFRRNDCLAGCGFISVQRDGCTTAATIANYVKDTDRCHTVDDGGEEIEYKDPDTNINPFTTAQSFNSNNPEYLTFSKYYDGRNRPCIYIYGVGGSDGTNTFCVSDSTTIEAYVGMYGGSSFRKTVSNSNSSEYKILIYGRIEADYFAGGNNSDGAMQMPYCPAPGGGAATPERYVEAKTKYQVANIVYYY